MICRECEKQKDKGKIGFLGQEFICDDCSKHNLINKIKKYCGEVIIEEDYIIADTSIPNSLLSEFLEFLELSNEEHEKI